MILMEAQVKPFYHISKSRLSKSIIKEIRFLINKFELEKYLANLVIITLIIMLFHEKL